MPGDLEATSIKGTKYDLYARHPIPLNIEVPSGRSTQELADQAEHAALGAQRREAPNDFRSW
eukprot:8438209-Pyramimonas_sp.AAC.1